MKKQDVAKQYTTPIGAPAFVKGPHRFTDREYLNITYRTDRDALVRIVPEPLEVDEPLVRFEVMKMPDTTGYGAYVECGQAAVVRHVSVRAALAGKSLWLEPQGYKSISLDCLSKGAEHDLDPYPASPQGAWHYRNFSC